MKILALLLVLSVPFILRAQDISWQNASAWKLYNFSSSHARQFHRDSLSAYGYIPMETDTMEYYLRRVEMIPRERSNGAVWMGDYWATCLLGDTTRILILSHYGGFFADFATGQYYELPLELRAAWHDYLNSKYLSLKREKQNSTQ